MNRVQLQLATRGAGRLFEMLGSLRGRRVGRWTLGDPIHAGRRSIVFEAGDAVAKMVSLPYHSPASFSREDVRRARRRLLEEAEALRSVPRGIFPRVLDVAWAANPLHVRAAREPFLILERLAPGTGSPALVWRQGAELLRRLYAAGWRYSDLSPGNLMVSEGLLRFVDGGGLLGGEATPEYLAPGDCRRVLAGEPWQPTPASSLASLARVVAELVTGRVPPRGEPLGPAYWEGTECPGWLRNV
jgi:hypothetical protein